MTALPAPASASATRFRDGLNTPSDDLLDALFGVRVYFRHYCPVHGRTTLEGVIVNVTADGRSVAVCAPELPFPKLVLLDDVQYKLVSESKTAACATA